MAGVPDTGIEDFVATIAVTRLVRDRRCGFRHRRTWCRARSAWL